MTIKDKIRLYKEAMGYMIHMVGIKEVEVPKTEGGVVVETVHPVKRIDKDSMLPEHLGNHVDIRI